MANPVSDLLSLTRAPAALASDLRAIAKAVNSVPAIEELLASLLVLLDPLRSDVERLRKTVEPQETRVAHIEQMMQALSQRTIVIEQAVLDLLSRVDAATELLPHPDDDRSALAKAKDVLSGG